MEYTIERAKLGDEGTLAYIQTESWKAGFREILDGQTLQRCTQLDRATAMYRRLLEAGIGNGYLLRVEGSPHCIAWWDATREKDMPGYAELICMPAKPLADGLREQDDGGRPAGRGSCGLRKNHALGVREKCQSQALL